MKPLVATASTGGRLGFFVDDRNGAAAAEDLAERDDDDDLEPRCRTYHGSRVRPLLPAYCAME